MKTIEELLAKFTLEDLPRVWGDSVWPAIQSNTSPPYYLVGGGITRTILNSAYATNLPIRNYDLAVGALSSSPELPGDWKIQLNMFGNWKMVSTALGIHVDVWPLNDWQRHEGCRIKTIDEALATVPVNIHAVAYDILAERVHFHTEYTRGLTDRCVRVLCKPEHDTHCAVAKVSIEQDLKYRAERFGFSFEL